MTGATAASHNLVKPPPVILLSEVDFKSHASHIFKSIFFVLVTGAGVYYEPVPLTPLTPSRVRHIMAMLAVDSTVI
jgi:hypothetical protein